MRKSASGIVAVAPLPSTPLDAYLEIAQRVLREARVPLRPREILKRGLMTDVVPARLYGQTQHKTLQARLSEDILLRRERSAFFRTKPGYFFLREFLSDASIAHEHRTPIIARRRRRELAYPEALSFDKQALMHLPAGSFIEADQILSLLKARCYHYAQSSREKTADDVVVWAFTLVLRNNSVLTYRQGRYREDRDNFLQKRSIGFFAPVVHDDLTLFDQSDHGIVASGLRALNSDLDLGGQLEMTKAADLKFFVCTHEDDPPNLLGVVSFQCPEWFEPFTRRLAINDLNWHDLDLPINHLDDFDPWSQLVLERARRTLGRVKRAADEASY
jgi:hypothetical protein